MNESSSSLREVSMSIDYSFLPFDGFIYSHQNAHLNCAQQI